MIGKVSRPVPGGRGRLHFVLPTSNANANSKQLGEVNRFMVLTLSYPPPAATINQIGKALDNLALAATNYTTVLHQLTASNLALTTANTALTAANKKLLEALAKKSPATTPSTPATPRPSNKPFPGYYCWTHGHCVSQSHTSATCSNKAAGHKDTATVANTMGGSDKGQT
jgi:hypothetical protein